MHNIHIHSFSFLQAKVAAALWGSIASVRRVMGIVIFFGPALGLLDLLWHWHAERVPFKVSNNIVYFTQNHQQLKNFVKHYKIYPGEVGPGQEAQHHAVPG